jgi:hypothetical protein
MKNRFSKLLLILLSLLLTTPFINAQTNVDILVVGAGGGGGAHQNSLANSGGGGGGGVVHLTSTTLNRGTYTVTVAPTTSGRVNGSGCAGVGPNGGNSSFTISGGITITAFGGGGGGGCNTANGQNGGSGGGGHSNGSGGSVTTSTCTGQSGGTLNIYGNSGSASTGNPHVSGGGGGASTTTGTTGDKNGGQGVSISITGTSHVYGAGGGGNSSTGGAGGTNAGNGASGTSSSGNGGSINAANNFGGGGGGSSCGSCTSGAGGSGVVIIRYASSTPLATGGTITSYTSGTTTYQVHTFTSNGTFDYSGIITTQPSTTAQNICVNGTASALTVAATGTSITYQWYSNTTASNTGGSLISGATSASYPPPTNVAGTRYYYCYVNNSSNQPQTSNVSGAINVGTVAGTISGSNSINSGSNATLTLSGHTGNIQWQSSINNSTFNTASGTSTNASYTTPNLTATTYYRAVVTNANGSCGSVNSNSATILVLPSTTPTSTSISISGTGTTNTMSRNTATVVDAGLTITGSGNISGFSISISENYSSGDVLGYTGSLPSGVTTSGFSTTSRSIVFKGNAIASVWQTFLRTITLTSTAGTCNPEKRKITFTVSTNFYNYFNGHYYEYVSSGRVWSSAKTNAESKTFFGRQGYLATINSAEENAYISKLIGQNSWLGATDNYLEINKAVGYSKYSSQSQAEGKYHWVSGPEKGVQVSNGSSSVSGRYLRWAGGEPNNYNTGFKDRSLNLFGEHYLHIYSSSSTWNDFPDDRSLGSIIEYGDMPGDNPVTTIGFTRDITISGLTSGSISGGLGTVCAGTNTTTLTLTGASGTVSRWESSPDNFLETTNTITSTSTSYTATNLTEKTFYRAVMVNGSCTLPTPSTYINVLELEAGVISAGSNEVCAGSAINLNLGGNKGTVTRWERTTNPVGSITNISSTSTSLSHTISTAGSYYIRTVVGNTSCSNSTQTDWYPVVVSASGAPTPGAVSSAAHCGAANSGVLTLSGARGGASYQWQQSTDGGSSWANASSTSTRFSYVDINRNTQYRVVVSNGSCGSANSSVGEIIIYGTTISQWTGGGSNNNWSTAANWCGEVVGTTGRRVAISEDALREPTLDANLSLAELNFNASGKKITLGNWNAEIQSILGADSLNYFKTSDTGSLIKTIAHSDSFTFAVGLANYNPVTIVNKTGTADQFSVYVFDEVYTNGRKGSGNAMTNKARIQSTWEIGKTNANAGSGVDFVFEWESSKRKNSISNPSLNHYNKNTRDWEFASNSTISRGTNSLRLTGYTGTFSPFAIGDGMTPLPVELISFTAKPNNNEVDLNWTSYSDNKNPFYILKSTDGVNWNTIETKVPSDNSVHYLFTDQQPAPVNYYQLSQLDNSNTLQYSDIRIVDFNSNKLVIFPNPNNGEFTIQSSNVVNYQISDFTGKVIMEGDNTNPLIKTNFAKGIYFIKISEGDKITFSKMIVQ